MSHVPLISLGAGDLTRDAWGVQKVSVPHSLFHGLFTFDIPNTQWFIYEGGTQVYTSTNAVSTDGALVVTANAAKSVVRVESRLCPPYEPNRGHLFSTAGWFPSKTADGVRIWGVLTAEAGVYFKLKADGLLYACIKSLGVETLEEAIDTSGVAGFDVEKGNIYDIQYQWRGVGDYNFFINNRLVHTFDNLGTLTALSMSNPALPACIEATRTTADVTMYFGCVDITSENGAAPKEERRVAYAAAVSTNGAAVPVLVVYNPLTISSKTNTRTAHVHAIALQNTKKCTFSVWRTRTVADITGATLVAGYGGVGSYVQSDSTDMNAGAVRATAATVANMEFLTAVSVEAGVRVTVDFLLDMAALTLVRGDYMVVTTNASTGSSEVVVTWGELI